MAKPHSIEFRAYNIESDQRRRANPVPFLRFARRGNEKGINFPAVRAAK